MKQLRLICHSDPGHAWIQVSKTLLKELEIENQITAYSYMDENNGYLEEDLDFGVFAKAAKQQGYELTLQEKYKENTPIRNMDSFSA